MWFRGLTWDGPYHFENVHIFREHTEKSSRQESGGDVLYPPIDLRETIDYYKIRFIDIDYAIILAMAFSHERYFGSKFAIFINDQAVKILPLFF